MIFYLPCVSILLTYFIFRSKGIDYRAVALGSLTPFTIDLFIGHASIGHSFIFAVGMFVLIMLGTISRPRLLRRRLLCFVIGIFFALVLEGTFLQEQTWWWPLTRHSSGNHIDIFPNMTAWIIREVVGLIALYIIFGIGELHIKTNRQEFFKQGRIST